MDTLEILRTLAGIGADEIRAALEDDSPIAAQYREDHGLHVWPIGDGWLITGIRYFSSGPESGNLSFKNREFDVMTLVGHRGEGPAYYHVAVKKNCARSWSEPLPAPSPYNDQET